MYNIPETCPYFLEPNRHTCDYLSKLSITEKIYKTLLTLTSDAVIIVDIEDNIIEINHKGIELIGYTKEEAVDLHLNNIHPKEELPRILTHFKAIVQNKTTIELCDTKILRKDGQTVTVDIKGSHIEYNGKSLIIVVIKNISEDIETIKLKKERDLAQRYLDIAVVIIVIINNKGIVELINKKGCEILGYEEYEIIGKNWFDNFIPERIREEIKDVARKFFCGEKNAIEYYENPILTKNSGEKIIAWHNKCFYNESNELIGSISSGEDITEKRRAQEQLSQYSKELKENNDRLKSFTYTVSHDLRAPLFNLIGFSSELDLSYNEIKTIINQSIQDKEITNENIKKLNDLINQDIPQSINFISISATKINNMMNALLELSRIGHIKLNIEPLDMNKIIKFTLDVFTHQIKTFNITITVNQLHQVYSDKHSLEQIIGNLIDNAIKYRSPDRPLTLNIYSQQIERETLFYFEDNGLGIDEQKTKKIFDVFYRIETNIGKDNIKGDGLGLANIKALVERLGGSIRCLSVIGRGSTFIFSVKDQFFT